MFDISESYSLFYLPTVSYLRLVSCKPKERSLVSFQRQQFLEVTVCLFRRKLAISAALLNKRSTAAKDGCDELYRINTSLADGNRCNVSNDLSLLAN